MRAFNKGLNISNQVISLIFLTSLWGCGDRTIEPYENKEAIYSIYGALEVGKNTNYIRVKDLQVPFGADEMQEFDATVWFENLESGIMTTLKDSVVRFSDNVTHNFLIEETIVPRGKYRITVERKEVVNVQTIATGPHATKVEADPTENVDCEQQIEFIFSNVPAPEQVRMEVGFFHKEQMHWSEVNLVDQLERIEDTDQFYISMSPRNLLVEVFTPRLEYEVDGVIRNPIPPRFLFPTVHCHELDSNVALIRYIHFGPEWEAVVPIWPVNPDDVLDVENGLGFVGAISRGSFSFTIKQNVSE